MSVIGTGKKWRDIFDQTTNLGKQGFSINVIKAWRTNEHEAGRPSSLEEFYKAHDICWDCRCLGFQITGYDESDKEQLFSVCPTCVGTGRVKVS
jgi:hypothetical protein